jgi:hypothetical protein
MVLDASAKPLLHVVVPILKQLAQQRQVSLVRSARQSSHVSRSIDGAA